MRGSLDASPKDCNLRHTQIRDVHDTQKPELLRPYAPPHMKDLDHLHTVRNAQFPIPIIPHAPHSQGFLGQAQHCSAQA